jgi:hypothetical protein
MHRSMFKDQGRMPKPLIDEYETEVFDQRICYAMEYNLAVKLTVWTDGFLEEFKGCIHYVDPISHQLRIEGNVGEIMCFSFEDVIGVKVLG